jgi:hypothetical protein
VTGSAASVLAALAVGLVAPADAAAACREDTRAADVRPRPGAPALRLGINPAGRAGASGPAVPAVPDRPARTLAALRRLQPAGPPLALRLNRFFWSHGDAGIRRFAALTRRYTRAGYLVELQLRYHPPAGREGDVAGFERWVRRVVRRFGANPRVVAVQVTNEVNLTVSPDSSDGAFSGARAALVRGVIAAADEARRRRYGQLSVGFNWVLPGRQRRNLLALSARPRKWALPRRGGLGRPRRLSRDVLPAQRDRRRRRDGPRPEPAAALLDAGRPARARGADPRRGERLADGTGPARG